MLDPLQVQCGYDVMPSFANSALHYRYMGTITGMGDLDSVRWPNSHWRSLKVLSILRILLKI